MEEEVVDYYSVGTVEDPVVSNSSMGAINPDEGGSPQKFIDFFKERTEEKYSASLERGTLVHAWHEHQEKFIVSDIEKPSAMMTDWVYRVFDILAPTGLHNISDELIMSMRNGAYASIKKEDKHLEKFREDGMEFLKFCFEGSGKIVMTTADKKIVDGCIEALNGHERAAKRLFFPVEGKLTRYKELEVYWIEDVNGVQVKCKAKIDNVIFDYEKKIIYLSDLKTTSKAVSLFKNSFKNYRYYRQIAWYAKACLKFLEQTYEGYIAHEWNVRPCFVVVDYTPYFNVDVFDVTDEWLQVGIKEYNEILTRIAWHTKNQAWFKRMPEKNATLLTLTLKDKFLLQK